MSAGVEPGTGACSAVIKKHGRRVELEMIFDCPHGVMVQQDVERRAAVQK